MDNREKLELLRQTVLAAAQRSAEETEAETKKIIEDTVSAEKKRLSDEISEIKSMSYDELRSRDEKELVTKDAKLRKNILVKREAYMRELFSELENRLAAFRRRFAAVSIPAESFPSAITSWISRRTRNTA